VPRRTATAGAARAQPLSRDASPDAELHRRCRNGRRAGIGRVARAARALRPHPRGAFALAGRALQVIEWDQTHRFCGRCGTPTERHPPSGRGCPSCGLRSYPRIAPAMMALVLRERETAPRALAAYSRGMYSALAGSSNRGDARRDAGARSPRGSRHRGREPALFRQPAVAFPHSLMVAFVADYARARSRRSPTRSKRPTGSASTRCRACRTRSASRGGSSTTPSRVSRLDEAARPSMRTNRVSAKHESRKMKRGSELRRRGSH